MSWTACSTPHQPTLEGNAARLAFCDPGSSEERADFGRIITLSKLEDDPHNIEEGVRWLGGYVKRCYPELFEKKES